MTAVAVIAGALGAICRYLVSGLVQARSDSDFPFGTLVVNLVGSFLLGAVAGVGSSTAVTTLALVAFLGGFTTFSTWMIETVRLGIFSLTARAVANLVLTLIAGVAFAALGYLVAGWVSTSSPVSSQAAARVFVIVPNLRMFRWSRRARCSGSLLTTSTR